MSTPSILSAVKKISSLLTREEKWKWVGIVSFALCNSCFEVVAASVVVIFAQVLNQPEIGHQYFTRLGITAELSSGRIVLYVAMAVGAIFLLKNLIAGIEVFYQNFSIQKMNYNFKNKLLYRYANTDYGFYLTRNSSLGIQVVGGDAEQMFSSGMISFASVISEGMIFLCLICMVIYMNPSLALAIFGIGVVLGIGIAKGLLPRFYQFGQKLQEASLYSMQNLIQFFHAFKEIVLLGKCDSFVNAYQFHSHKKSRVQAMHMAINALPRMVLEVLFVGLFVVTIAFLCLENESSVQMMGILGGYLYVGFRLMPGLNRMINQLNTFKSVIPSIERVHHEYTSIAVQGNYIDVPNFHFESQISVQDISFRYLNTKKDSLSGVSFEIKKGECIGVIGETGSGKSTLVDVILGLLKPSGGSILVDDKYPVNSYQWHQKIGYVPQSIYLTDDTIEANIAFGEQKINELNLNAAMDASQLRKFIDQLPEGSKTIVGERGIRLSGGERQRIAIARALYRNPEVLIFDEATSALDNETEARLMETIYAVSQTRTVIMIAHRFTTLKGCEKIIVMNDGVLEKITDYCSIEKMKLENYA